MSYRQISYYTDKPILSNKDILYLYVVKKPMSGHPWLEGLNTINVKCFPLD